MKVEVRRSGVDDRHGLELLTPDRPGVLVHTAELGCGLTLDVDPLAPDRWSRLAVHRLDEVSEAVLAVVVGEQAVRAMRSVQGPARRAVRIDGSDPGPWRRLAVVDALDRWLPLRLDQSLVDAERGVARLQAAATLPPGAAAHRLVVGEALVLARRGAAGFAAHLARSRRRGSPLPPPVCVGLRSLVDGYRALGAHVAGPDRDLAAVVRAWEALRAQSGTGVAPNARRPAARWRRGTSMIDPRAVPARLLRLSADPDAGEVRLTAVTKGSDELQIDVPAFDGDLDELMARRLVVRVVDRRTAEPLTHGLLTISPGRRSARCRAFRCTMPRPGPDVSDLRVEVFDALADPPPSGDEGVREARRAVAALRETHLSAAAACLAGGAGTVDEVERGGLLVAEVVAAAEQAGG
jgi:hypothetical protein